MISTNIVPINFKLSSLILNRMNNHNRNKIYHNSTIVNYPYPKPVSFEDSKDNDIKDDFHKYFFQMETWARLICVNISENKLNNDNNEVDYCRHFKMKKYWFFILVVRSFLLLYLLKELILTGIIIINNINGYSNINSERMFMIYIGDLYGFYPFRTDRFAFHALKLSWSMHATIIYCWISGSVIKLNN